MVTMRFAIGWCLLLLSSLASFGQSQFVDTPSVLWTYQLPGSGTLRKGNAVVSTTVEDIVFCAADDGSLHIINPDDLESSVVVEAPSISGADTECRSGVAIRETDGVFEYAVYAVTFTPTSQGSSTTSRIIAVDKSGSEIWSQDVDGSVEGTPVVGVTGIYVSHNIDGVGRVTVIIVANNAAAVAAEIDVENGSDSFGPLSSQVLLMGGEVRDVVFWGDVNDAAELGLIYALMPSETFNDGIPGAGRSAYSLLTVAQWRRSLVTKPTVSSDLTALYLAGSGGVVSGWTGDSSPIQQIDGSGPARFTWRRNLDSSGNDALEPFLTSMVLSSGGESLYLIDFSFNVVCLNASSGTVIWRNDGPGISGYSAEPRLSEIDGENAVVYVIEEVGNIRQHDATNGDINWQFDCSDRGGANGCEETVEADFYVTFSGNLLYFGDVSGKVSAVEVATFPFVRPTAAPTIATPAPTRATPGPTSAAIIPTLPTNIAPSETEQPSIQASAPAPDMGSLEPTPAPAPKPKPTLSPVIVSVPDNSLNAAAPTNSGSSDGNKTLLIAMIALFAVAAIAATSFFVLMVRRKKKIQEQQEDIRRKREAQRIWEEQQKQLEEDCLQQELEMINGLGADKTSPQQPSTPKRTLSMKKKSSPSLSTPITLASIEEVANEDMSVATEATSDNRRVKDVESGYGINHAISNLTSLTYFGGPRAGTGDIPNVGEDEKKDDEKASGLESYLPQALVSTFDTVVNLGRGGTTDDDHGEQSGRSISPPREISTYHLSEKEAFQRYYVPGSDGVNPALGAGLGMYSLSSYDSGDESSIGSESLFVDEDSKSAHLTLSSDASQPGIISTRATKDVEQEETGNGAWTSLMSTLIQAEKEFFNPLSTQRKKVTPPPTQLSPGELSPLDDLSLADDMVYDIAPDTGFMAVPELETPPSDSVYQYERISPEPAIKAPFDEPEEDIPFDVPAPARAMSPPNSSVGSI